MNEIIYWKAKNIYRSHKRLLKQKLSEPALIDQIQYTFSVYKQFPSKLYFLYHLYIVHYPGLRVWI
jgi:hypothetical protein